MTDVRGRDVYVVVQVMNRVQGRLGERYAFDAQWVEATDKKATQLKERIESDLNAAKSSVIKESIRMVRTAGFVGPLTKGLTGRDPNSIPRQCSVHPWLST
jgi:hypothetical protein